MPSPTTNEEFLDLVRKSGVVDDKRLSAHLERLRAAGPLPPEPIKLAMQLVRDGVLTHFQAEQFLQGKWRRFTIGKYKVLERLGAGGMGSVYLCEHMLMRRRVAVKVLPASKAEDTASLERFYREARAVAALDHPNIVRAYDIDQDDKLHFLVMEHVDGSSFQEIVKRTGPMDVLRAAHYVRQAALGLQHAHETAGLVHRDIKPGNILVDRNGIVKVLDMGLARFFHDEADDLTRKHDENVLGTADYLAPEQALDSHGVDIRADIYSLGATFYFCLTGRTPFAEGTVAQKLIWHQTRQPKPIRSIRPEVPEGIAAVIERMMAKAPEGRYPTPQAVADTLVAWTQTPIPPPPESEMPQFSLAAKGSGEASMAPAMRSASDPSPVPRKVWQVSPTVSSPGPSSPGTQPITPPSPPPSPSPSLSTAPSLGDSATAPVVRETRAATTAPPSPAPAPPSRPVPTVPARPAPSPVAGNGTGTGPGRPTSVPAMTLPAPPAVAPARAPARSAPAEPAPAEVESWDSLEVERTDLGEAPAARRRRSGSGKKVAGRKARGNNAAVWWVVGGVAVAVCAVVALILALVFLLGGGPRKETVRDPIRVGPGHKTSLRQALASASSGDRIILTSDIVEADLLLDGKDGKLKNLTIEGEAGKTVVWRFPARKDKLAKMMVAGYVEGLVLKNLTISGEGRGEILIALYGKCPGTRLENIELKGYQKCGVYVMNCEGSAEQKVQFAQLRFDSPPGGAGVRFDLLPRLLVLVDKNRFFAFQGCTFKGGASKVQTTAEAGIDRATMDLDNIKIDVVPK
jgi:serine/threonine protein kinase